MEDVMDMILLNVRVPEERRGDYNAQIASNKLGIKRCLDLIKKWGSKNIDEGCDVIIKSVAKRTRKSVSFA